jgi:hypothetical protein
VIRRPATIRVGTVAREPDAVQRIRVPANAYEDQPGHQRLDAKVRPTKPRPVLATA